MKGISRAMLILGIAFALRLGALPGGSVQAAPLLAGAFPLAATPAAIPAAGCRTGYPDCDNGPTEIDIAPQPPHRDDPIAREIERFGPPPLEPCETRQVVTQGRRATHDADACGIRCWYWRLRYGYCGPGCEYYRYRMYHYGKDGYHHPRYACGS